MEVKTLGTVMPLAEALAHENGEVFVLSMEDRETLHHELLYLYAIREHAKALVKAINDNDDTPPAALQHLRWLLETARVYH